MAPEKDWLAEALADWIESIIAGKIITGADNLRSLLAAMAVWTRGCVRSRDAPSLSSPLLTLTFARVLTPLRPRRRNHLSKPRHHVFALSPRKLVPCHERALRWIESPAAPVPPPVLVHRPLLHDTTRPRDHETMIPQRCRCRLLSRPRRGRHPCRQAPPTRTTQNVVNPRHHSVSSHSHLARSRPVPPQLYPRRQCTTQPYISSERRYAHEQRRD